MKNRLFYGDNLDVLRRYVKDETVDLCYIDPPFNSKRNYNQIYNNVGKEDRAQAQAFTDTWTWDTEAEKGLADIQSNPNGKYTRQTVKLISGLSDVLGKGSLLAYLVSMTLRIVEIYRVLKPTGSFYFHCDQTASHYLKLVLDTIFCSHGGDFLNEIIWCYRQGGRGKNKFPSKHDTIFLYSKGKTNTFNADAIRVPYEGTGGYVSKGRNIVNGKEYKTNPLGKIPEDWWDIAALNPEAKERLGYPTQKPEKLLERIIKASSNEGDVVLDAYCGCGTSVAVAEQMKRNWIGIDITYQSISLIMKRLEDTFGKDVLKNITLSGTPEDMESAVALANKADDRTRKEFEKWAVLTYSNNRARINEAKGGDGGIDGIAYVADRDENQNIIAREVLFSVKSNKTLSPSVIRDLFGTIEREKAAIGYLITLYPMENLVKESKKYGTYTNTLIGQSYPKIEVISVEDILQNKRLSLPISLEVVKSAERKEAENDNPTLFD